jgi:hypothetical protein
MYNITKFEGRNLLRTVGVDGRILLKWILKERDGRVRIGFIWLRIGANGGLWLTR